MEGNGRGRGRITLNEFQGDLRRPNVIPPELIPTIPNQYHRHPNPTLSNQINFHQIHQIQQRQMGSFEYTGLPQNLSALSLGNSNISASVLSPNAPEFVPRSQTNSQEPTMSTSGMPEHMMPQLEFINNPFVHQIDGLIVNLTVKPFKFDETAGQIANILSTQAHTSNFMNEIVTMIFEQGVGEDNFRYSGAKLCQYLHQNIKQIYTGPSFKDILYKRCREEFNCREYFGRNMPNRLLGFSHFLTEIFTHMVSDDPQDVEFLRTAICVLALLIINNPCHENLKSVVKVLKASGSALDTGDNKHMDELMFRLKDLATNGPITSDSKSMLISLIELRASNWGKSSDTPSTPATTPPEMPLLGTVYYTPEGQIKKVVLDDHEDSLSEEENHLLSSNSSAPNVEELYGEEAAAFELFLQSQKKTY